MRRCDLIREMIGFDAQLTINSGKLMLDEKDASDGSLFGGCANSLNARNATTETLGIERIKEDNRLGSNEVLGSNGQRRSHSASFAADFDDILRGGGKGLP